PSSPRHRTTLFPYTTLFRSRIVVGVQRFLAAVGGDHLAEVTLLIQHPDADHRHPEIAGRLELIGCDVAETTRVNRQRLAEREFQDRKSTRLNSSHLGISYAV